MKISKLLSNNNYVSKYLIYLISFIIFFIFFFIYFVKTVYPNDYNFVLDIATILLSIITSLLSAFIFYNYTVNRDSNKVNKIVSIAEKDFMLNLLEELDRYGGNYCEDWHIDIEIDNIDDLEGMVRCSIKYNYIKFYKKDVQTIKMIFFRILKDNDINNIPQHINFANHYEFYWVVDERDFKNPIEKEYYNIRDIIINNRKFNASKEEYDTKIEYTIDNFCVEAKRLSISYEVDLILEKNDMMQINIDVPTKNATIRFTYPQDKFEAYGMESVSLTTNPVSLCTDGRIEFSFDGWLEPKNSFVFAWWSK